MKRAFVATVLSFGCLACEEKQTKMENLAADNDVVKAASAAANEVIRNATDCGSRSR